MTKDNKIRIRMIFLGMIMYFFSGTIYLLDGRGNYHLIMLGVSIGIILFTNIVYLRKLVISLEVLDFFYIIFILSLLFSYLLNFEKSSFISFLGIMILYIFSRYIAPLNLITYRSVLRNIHTIIILPYFIVILYSIFTYPILFERYSGIFSNPNGQGSTAATIAGIIMAILVYDLKKNSNKKKILIEVFLLFITIVLVLISTSRTAIITVLILLIVFMSLHFYRILNLRKIITSIIAMLFTSLILYFIFNFTEVGNSISSLFYKFQSRDLFSNRNEIWSYVYSNFKFFGNGESDLIAAHNTFLSILHQYGLIAFLSLSVYHLLALFYSFKFAINKNIPNQIFKYIPIFMNIVFILMSITESMMLKLSMLVVVFFNTVVLNHKALAVIDNLS